MILLRIISEKITNVLHIQIYNENILYSAQFVKQ